MPTNNCSAEYKKLSITVQVWDSYLWICYFCARTWCHSSTYLLDLAPERGRVELLDSLLSPDAVPVYCALSHLYISPKIGDNLIWTYVIWCFTSWQTKFNNTLQFELSFQPSVWTKTLVQKIVHNNMRSGYKTFENTSQFCLYMKWS